MAAWRHGAWRRSPTGAILYLNFRNSVRSGTACSTGGGVLHLSRSSPRICWTSVLQMFTPAPWSLGRTLSKKVRGSVAVGRSHSPPSARRTLRGAFRRSHSLPSVRQTAGVEYDCPKPGKGALLKKKLGHGPRLAGNNCRTLRQEKLGDGA